MTSNIVKCSSCNIVINEVLTFVYNKISVMDETSLSRICVTAFTAEDILIAKKLLFEAVPMKKMINRKKDDKSRKDLEDIIDMLKHIDATDPERLPIFVARELHKLPPVSFDHLDATRLLKDILKLQEQLSNLQTEMGGLKNEFVTRQELNESPKLKQSEMYFDPVNKRRGACIVNSFECNSGPIGLEYVPDRTITSKQDTSTVNIIKNNAVMSVQGQDIIHVEARTPVSVAPSKRTKTSLEDSRAWRPLQRFRTSDRLLGAPAPPPAAQ